MPSLFVEAPSVNFHFLRFAVASTSSPPKFVRSVFFSPPHLLS